MIVDFLKVYYLQILMMSPFFGVTIYGILTNINKFLKKLRCTETITGTITSVRKVSRNTNGGGRGRRNIVINKPTCTYMYDGVTYEREIDDSIGITDEKRNNVANLVPWSDEIPEYCRLKKAQQK